MVPASELQQLSNSEASLLVTSTFSSELNDGLSLLWTFFLVACKQKKVPIWLFLFDPSLTKFGS